MERALEAHRATGANFQSSYNLSRLADAHARTGDLEAALALADEAIADGRRSGEQWWEAEAQRRRGEILLLASPPDRAEAEASFQRALACARRQQAALWELGAARSLAELWSTEGRRSEAYDLLAPVCARFSDGFAFEDLRRAQESLRTFA
jgi:predicted ATPase